MKEGTQEDALTISRESGNIDAKKADDPERKRKMPVKSAALYLNSFGVDVTHQTVRKWIARGCPTLGVVVRLKAIKISKSWWTTTEWIDEFLRECEQTGTPVVATELPEAKRSASSPTTRRTKAANQKSAEDFLKQRGMLTEANRQEDVKEESKAKTGTKAGTKTGAKGGKKKT